MSAPGFFRIKKLTGSGIVLAASRHNKRVIQAEYGAAGHIDAARICLNTVLHGPATPQAVAQRAKDLKVGAGIRSDRKKAVMALELVFSLPPGTPVDPPSYFKDCLPWVARNFGGFDNMLSADIHMDESAPHMHVLLLPLIEGRMKGSDLVGNRQRLQFLQNDFHAAVAARYGLAKAPARLQGRAKEETAQAVIAALRASNDQAQESALWPILRDFVDRDPAPFAHLLGIEVSKPNPPKLRTMAQIMTSKGKGSNRPEKPIGFANMRSPIGAQHTPKVETLSCVGIAHNPVIAARRKPAPAAPPVQDDDRVVDRADVDFADWSDDCRAEPEQWT
ncbi:MAG: plasmid recombination protein [Bdellovibrionales bacterium]|nr:plasmid recombination protein [Ramlibacter sp.]